MWVVRAVICKLEFLGDEDEILTTDMLKVRCRTKCNVSVSVLTDPRCILNGRHVTQATKDWKRHAFRARERKNYVSEKDKFQSQAVWSRFGFQLFSLVTLYWGADSFSVHTLTCCLNSRKTRVVILPIPKEAGTWSTWNNADHCGVMGIWWGAWRWLHSLSTFLSKAVPFPECYITDPFTCTMLIL